MMSNNCVRRSIMFSATPKKKECPRNIGHLSPPFSRRAVPAAFERVIIDPAAGKARRLN